MENSQFAKSSMTNPDNVKTLVKIQKVFSNYFEQALDDYCSRLDVEFDRQFGKDRDNYDKAEYSGLLSYLRSEKDKVNKHCLKNIQNNFEQFQKFCQGKQVKIKQKQINLKEVSLTIDDGTLEEEYFLNKLIRNSNEQFYEDLGELNSHFAKLFNKHKIATAKNPVAPVMLVQAIEQALKQLDLKPEHRVVLYQVFENDILRHISFIYQEILEFFNTGRSTAFDVVDTLSVKKVTVIENPENQVVYRQAFDLLKDRLSNWRVRMSPSIFDAMPKDSDSSYEDAKVIEVLELIQLLIAVTGIPQNWHKQLIKHKVLDKLIKKTGINKRPLRNCQGTLKMCLT